MAIAEQHIEDVPTTVLCNTRCHLGEGPAYDVTTDTAWWFDILERRLFEAHLATTTVGVRDAIAHALPVMASALAFIDDGRQQLLAADDGLYVRSIADGRLQLHWPVAGSSATRWSTFSLVSAK